MDTGWTFTTPLSTHYLNTHVVTTAAAIFNIEAISNICNFLKDMAAEGIYDLALGSALWLKEEKGYQRCERKSFCSYTWEPTLRKLVATRSTD